jgi:hypothetical protein
MQVRYKRRSLQWAESAIANISFVTSNILISFVISGIRFVCKESKSSENVLEYLSVARLFPENSILFFSASTVFTLMTHKFGYSWAGLFQKSGLNEPLKYTEDILQCAGGLIGVAVAPYIFYRFLAFLG